MLDADGRPSFELMQQHATQVAFYVFDVLSVDGHDTVSLPYEQRRELVAGLVEAGPNWMVPAHRIGDGAALLAATVERGLEGVMAKRLGSVYTPGKRTPNWRKVKNRRTVEVVIGGYTPGTGNRDGDVRRRCSSACPEPTACGSPAASAPGSTSDAGAS